MRSVSDKVTKLAFIRECGIIAILRANSSENLLEAIEAIYQGGVKVMEVTFTTPGALRLVDQVKDRFGNEILFGMGNVLDSASANQVILSGADFLVTPVMKVSVIEQCSLDFIPLICGCYTPTEILTARETGADLIKWFPANLGGVKGFRTLRVPLRNIDIIPVGGVDLTNIADYIRAGAVAVGVGNSLVDQFTIDNRKTRELTERAIKFIAEIKRGRMEQDFGNEIN